MLRRVTLLVSWAIFGYLVVVEIILLVGFVMILVGVEPSSWLTEWLYVAVERTMQPFRGAFTTLELADPEVASEVEPTVESSIVFAMIVYGILALAAHDLVEWLGSRTSSTAGQSAVTPDERPSVQP